MKMRSLITLTAMLLMAQVVSAQSWTSAKSQGPVMQTQGQGIIVQGPVQGTPVYGAPAPYAPAYHGGAPCHVSCEPCCPPPCKYCVPEYGTKKVTKYIYDCKCEDFCLPKCRFKCCLSFFKGHHGCDPCCQPTCCDAPCDDCEKPRTRKVLIKKPKVTEECETKCKVVDPCKCEEEKKDEKKPEAKPAAPAGPKLELAPPPKEKK